MANTELEPNTPNAYQSNQLVPVVAVHLGVKMADTLSFAAKVDTQRPLTVFI